MLGKIGKSRSVILAMLVVIGSVAAGWVLGSAGGSSAGASAGVNWYVPQNDITGDLSTAKFVAIGKKFDGGFCNGSRSGKLQGLVVVYAGSDPAALTQFIKDTTGVNPGTRLVGITKDTVSDCTDGNLGDIYAYSGTEE